MALRKYKVVTNPLTNRFVEVEAEKYSASDGFFHFTVLNAATGTEEIVASFSQELTPQVILINE
ncbi:hypothetical protein [Leucobacter luti]|uniref:hypothetical protein n=1 Tax=Leucobacter luti TaxID=340320 RepID=UPI003D065AEE